MYVPPEILKSIFVFMDSRTACAARLVCREWDEVIHGNLLTRMVTRLLMETASHFDGALTFFYREDLRYMKVACQCLNKLGELCRHAAQTQFQRIRTDLARQFLDKHIETRDIFCDLKALTVRLDAGSFDVFLINQDNFFRLQCDSVYSKIKDDHTEMFVYDSNRVSVRKVDYEGTLEPAVLFRDQVTTSAFQPRLNEVKLAFSPDREEVKVDPPLHSVLVKFCLMALEDTYSMLPQSVLIV